METVIYFNNDCPLCSRFLLSWSLQQLERKKEKIGYLEKNIICLTLSMLGNVFKYLFLSKFSKNSLFLPIFFADI